MDTYEKACLIVTLTIALGSAGIAKSPDIIMITVDDLRPMLGCYGHQRIRTPSIDRLAKRGLVFNRAYCQYAKCGTSRLSLMTGLRPDSIGVFSNNVNDVVKFRQRRGDATSIARLLKDHGYHTQSFGKIYHDGWDLASDWSVPSSPGRPREMWEVVDVDQPTKPTQIAERLDCPIMQSPDVADSHLFAGRMTDQVVKTLRNETADMPKFYAIGYRRPHLPFVAPKKYFDQYDVDESWLAKNPLPNVGAPIMSWFNSDGYVGSARKVGLTMPNPPNRMQAIDWNGYEMRSYVGVPNQGSIDKALQRQLIQAYAACVSYVDAQIGRLLDELQTQNRLQNTVIIFCSDHGWHLGEHSAWGKMTNYEIATRVPLIVAGPDIKAGHTDSIAELVDLYPTVCDFAGVSYPDHIQGESLFTAPARASAPQASAISQYSRFKDKYMGYAIRTDRYRYVRWINAKSKKTVAQELFDHQFDPGETKNLAGSSDHAKILEKMNVLLSSTTELSLRRDVSCPIMVFGK